MFNHFLRSAAAASLVALVGITLGCDARSRLAPTPQTSPGSTPQPSALQPPSVTGISPNNGSTLGTALVTIRGTGFDAREGGPRVTFDGVPVTVTFVTSTTITTTAPAHAAGAVDVVVTNPDGQSARLAQAFTYFVEQPYAVRASVNTVAAGGQLSVTWTAPKGGGSDWIGLFKVGDPNTNYELWWKYTEGGVSGTLTLAAPAQPGQYEFRYLLDDGYVDVVRSGPVTVTAGAPSVL